MGEVFDGIDEAMRAWLSRQRVFFVSTAPLAADGWINCSPKGYDCLRVLSAREVAYLDLTGSGAETIANLKENGRIVLMFCSFDQMPRIVRLHGRGVVYEIGSPEFEQLLRHFTPQPGMRAIIHVTLTRISDSCGYGVPRYQYLGERATLREWAVAKGDAGIAEYQRANNAVSINGLPGLQFP